MKGWSVKLSELLKQKIADDLGLRVIEIERIRRGRHGKAAGTWAWSARTDDGREIGSEDTMRHCVMAERLATRRPPWDFGRTLHIDAVRASGDETVPRA
jgi:hypothetical protein